MSWSKKSKRFQLLTSRFEVLVCDKSEQIRHNVKPHIRFTCGKKCCFNRLIYAIYFSFIKLLAIAKRPKAHKFAPSLTRIVLAFENVRH